MRPEPTPAEAEVLDTPAASDSVCGMEVDPRTAAAISEHDGEIVYSARPGARSGSTASPARYAPSELQQPTWISSPAGIQILVSREQIARTLGERGIRQGALTGPFGLISSCSFAVGADPRLERTGRTYRLTHDDAS